MKNSTLYYLLGAGVLLYLYMAQTGSTPWTPPSVGTTGGPSANNWTAFYESGGNLGNAALIGGTGGGVDSGLGIGDIFPVPLQA